MPEDTLKYRENNGQGCRLTDVDGQQCDKCTQGRILRVKHGYNPNSSSMGSLVFVLPAALLGVTTGFGVISGIIMSAFIKDGDRKTSKSENQAQEE